MKVRMELRAAQLSIDRGGRRVLQDVSFALPGGALMTLTGPNGAGKSTLLRAVAGFIPPVSGAVKLVGGDPEADLAEQAHYLGHQDAVKGALTPRETLSFWARMLGGAVVSVEDALDGVGLLAIADIPAAYLSAGQRKRLSIARLITAKRPVWLLDEPANAIDAAGMERLAALIRSHLDGGGLAIAATHAPLGIAADVRLRLGPALGAAA